MVPGTTPVPEREEDEAETSEDRSTLVPPYDVEAFARDSEVRQRVALSSEPGVSTIDAARRLHADGQPEEALFLLARLLEQVPLDAEARALKNECSAALERDCLAALGKGSALLSVAVPPETLKGLGLDNVSGFLLSLMDGNTDVDTILDLSGLPRLLALRHLRQLVMRGIVLARRRAGR